MKTAHYSLAALILLLTAGCNRPPANRSIVSETYVQKYGVVVPSSEDWISRGQQGKVITQLKNGVTVTSTYDQGILDGDVTYTFPHNEVVQRREVYDQGTLLKEILYSPSKLPLAQTELLPSGQRIVTSWYDSGVPQKVERYGTAGVLISGEYYTTDGAVASVVEEGEGLRIVRDGYGQLECKEKILGGTLAKRMSFHTNGTLKEEIPFACGVIEGLKKTYLPGGEPLTAEEWHQNKQQGITIVFRNGEKFAEVPYVDGVKQGVERRFKEGVTLVEEVSWREDLRHGPTIHYVGNQQYQEWYYRDQMVSKQSYDKLKGVLSG